MLFDDRLETVLRNRASGEAAMRTQFRQLLDLLGGNSADTVSPEVTSGFERLDELSEAIGPADQAAILEEPWLNIQSPYLVEWFSSRGPRPAAAILSRAQLSDKEWQELIPRLDVTSRGFLRHRRDLPQGANETLARLGVGDLVLPKPDFVDEEQAAIEEATAPAPAQPEPAETNNAAPASETVIAATAATAGLAASNTNEPNQAIGALRKRIEDYQLAKKEGAPKPAMGDPRLPLGDEAERAHLMSSFEFASDAAGLVTWAEPRIAPMLVGAKIAHPSRWSIFKPAPPLIAAMAERRPFSAAALTISPAQSGELAEGAPDEIAGQWLVDGAPIFAPESGAFEGYSGRMRRDNSAQLSAISAANDAASQSAEQMRQLLHELRTPINAIQGFAEVIQQQVFGRVPNAYRALAAAIALDAANLLGGFDEIDRLAKLDSGTMELEDGQCDWREVIALTVKRLNNVLAPREAGFNLSVAGSPFIVALDREEALALAWRILASLAGQVAPGETLEISLLGEGARAAVKGQALLSIALPIRFADGDDAFAAGSDKHASSISSGMFGTGFTLRLAQQEARAAGGSLQQDDGQIMVNLPVLTDSHHRHSEGDGLERGAGAA